MTPQEETALDGRPRLPPGRNGKLAVIAIIIFALAFAVGGFFAVKAITAGRGPRGGQGPGVDSPPAEGAVKASPKS